MYVYIISEPSVWTVGFYKPDGAFYSESDHTSADKAAERVAWLNGSGFSSIKAMKPPGKHPLRFGKKYLVVKIQDIHLEDMLNDMDRDGFYLKDAFVFTKSVAQLEYTLIFAKRERG